MKAAPPKAAAHESPRRPGIVEDHPEYLVVYKPPLMHTVPLKQRKQGKKEKKGKKGKQPLPCDEDDEETLLDWCAARFPGVLEPRGENRWEGGMVHRLDYETQGLTLVAKTQATLDRFRAQQERGLFIKIYHGVCRKAPPLPGFPPAPAFTGAYQVVESAFRAFGPGRKQVRPTLSSRPGCPALDRGRPYRTEILSARTHQGRVVFKARIARGFRHQIRCHLAWLGFPLLNDILYGGARGERTFFHLVASSISFMDPLSGRRRTVSTEPS